MDVKVPEGGVWERSREIKEGVRRPLRQKVAILPSPHWKPLGPVGGSGWPAQCAVGMKEVEETSPRIPPFVPIG